MDTPKTYGDQLRGLNSTVLWSVTFIVVGICVFGLDPLEVMRRLLENEGVGVDDAALIGFAAGLTLPLTIGTGIIVFILLSAIPGTIHPYRLLIVSTVVLYITSMIAADQKLGLSLVPGSQNVGGGPARPLLLLLSMYLTSYGFPLMFASLTVGAACGIQVERWYHSGKRGTGLNS
jgi:hypothetical protein